MMYLGIMVLCLANQAPTADNCMPFISDTSYETEKQCITAVYTAYNSSNIQQQLLKMPAEDQLKLANIKCVNLLGKYI